MATNEILNFAQGGSANVESQADYAADTLRTNGNQPGVAISAFNNKALRQACWIASVLAQFIVNTSGSDVLDDGNQTNLLAAMALTWPSGTFPTVTRLTATGTTAGYLFTCSTANATVGAVYANNGNNYTVLATLSSGTLLWCSGASAPTSSGTLTKQSGTGDATITFSATQALAVYTPPANVKYLDIKILGGGGGGGGGGVSSNGGTGGNGGTTAFGPGLVAFGGVGGQSGNVFGTGGSFTNTLGTNLGSFNGGGGNGGGYGQVNSGAGNSGAAGGGGGSSPFGGAGGGGYYGAQAGGAASTSSGSGGGGGGAGESNTTIFTAGSGGGAGAFVSSRITSIGSSYYYAIGSGGSGGSGGSSQGAGGAGAAGIIIIDEHYAA